MEGRRKEDERINERKEKGKKEKRMDAKDDGKTKEKESLTSQLWLSQKR